MNLEILIIVQASADLRYAFDLINRNKSRKVHLLIVNVESIFKFVKSLDIQQIHVSYIKEIEVNFKKPLSLIRVKRELKSLLSENFSNIRYQKVYFFSRFHDWITSAIINRISLENNGTELVYYDHYDTSSVINDSKLKSLSLENLRNQYFIQVFRFLTGVRMVSRYRKRFIEFNYWDYEIKKIEVKNHPIVVEQFKYCIKDRKCNRILFMLSPSEEEMIDAKSYVSLVSIIEMLNDLGFSLYIKGHPRLGIPTKLKKYFSETIPNYVPSEFLNYNNYQLIIGIMSSGLVYPAMHSNIKVIALIELLEFNKKEDQHFFMSFLKEHSKNSILIPESIEKFNELINNVNNT